MTIKSADADDRGRPGDAEEYRLGFLANVHELLAEGHRRLSDQDLQKADEETISGKLASAIREYIEDGEPPDWKTPFSVHNESPSNDVPERTGKQRPVIDIELERTGRGPHPRFQFEAKRLRRTDTHSVSEYLGFDGIRCFLDGRYSKNQPHAGMLGFIQTDSPDHWIPLIKKKILSEEVHKLVVAAGWSAIRLVPDGDLTYVTTHDRPAELGGPITIYHTLLMFCIE